MPCLVLWPDFQMFCSLVLLLQTYQTLGEGFGLFTAHTSNVPLLLSKLGLDVSPVLRFHFADNVSIHLKSFQRCLKTKALLGMRIHLAS